MSTTVDERVVEMRFDNKQFESNVQTSMSTLDKLKQSLKLDGASKGLEDVGAAANKINLNPLGNAVESIGLKFNAMYTIADQALRNIVNSAMFAGKQIVSALAIDPVKTGFQEYETQINAVQTILANTESKGSTLEDVNNALDELNTYADKTIYNFTEMTKNIGTFTAAGIDLETSVKSIQGIANLAAVSGSTSQQASTAMYQLSQALAAGKIQLMDWNSVVNAGMGGQLFQDALKRTATQMGYNVDALIEKYGSFRESLTKGEWLTAEVLTETLTQLSGAYSKADLIAQGYTEKQAEEIVQLATTASDAATKVKTFTQLWDTLKEAAQSGWTQTWEIVIGDFEEAKELFSGISDTVGKMIGDSADARNKLLEGALGKQSSYISNWQELSNVGLATEAFQKAITETAKSHGIAIDQMIKDEGSFANTLKNNWLTTDLISETLNKFTGEVNNSAMGLEELDKIAKSVINGTYGAGEDRVKALTEAGYDYATVQSYVNHLLLDSEFDISKLSDAQLESAGYTREQIEELRELAKTAEETGTPLNKLMESMSKPSGRELLIESLKNAFTGLVKIFTQVKKAFRSIFPATTSEQLYKLIESIHAFSERLIISNESAIKLRRTFKGLFSAIDIGLTFIKAVASGIAKLFGNFKGLGGGILNVTASIGDWLINLRKGVKETGSFGKAINGATDFLQKIIDKVKEFTGSGLKSLGDILLDIWGIIKKIGGKIAETFSSIGTGISDAFKSGNIDAGSILDVLNAGLFTAIVLGVKNFLQNFKKTVDGLMGQISDLIGNVTDVLDSVRDCLVTYQQKIKSEILLKIAIAMAVLVASIAVLAFIDEERVTSAISAITTMFIELVAALRLIGKGRFEGAFQAISFFIGISAAVLILSFALKNISSLDSDQMEKGLLGILGLTAIVVAAAKLLSKETGKVMKGASSLVIFSLAIKILAKVCRDLATLSWEELFKGLIGIGVLMAGIVIFTKTAKMDTKIFKTALAMILMGAALKIFASVCADFASMSWEDISKGLVSVGALLLEFAAFSKLTGNSKKVLATSLAIVIFASCMKIFASVFQDLSSLSWDDIGRGLLAIGGSLLVLVLAVKKLKTNDLAMIGMVLPAVASAMIVMAEALERISKISVSDLVKSVATVAVTMLILTKGLNAMQKKLKGAVALIVAAAALFVLAHAFSVLAKIDVVGLVVGLTALAGVFLIIGVATKLLKRLIPSIISLSGALALMGLSLVVLGAGIAVIGVGLFSFISSFVGAILVLQGLSWEDIGKGILAVAATFVIIGIAGKLLRPVIPSILGLAASFALFAVSCLAIGAAAALVAAALSSMALVGEEGAKAIISSLKMLIVGFFEVIEESLPHILESVKTIILGLIDILIECTPALVDGVLVIIFEVLGSLSKYVPKIVELLLVLVIDIINGIAKYIPDIIVAVMNLIGSIFDGVIQALNEVDTDNLIKGIAAVGLMASFVKVLASVSGSALAAIKGLAVVGILIAELSGILAAIGALQQIPGLQWLIDEGGKLLESIGVALGKAVGGLIGGVMSGITGQLPEIGTDLSTFMTNVQPFIDGAKTIDASTLTGVKTLADVILTLTGAGVLDGLTSWLTGSSSISKFGEELVGLGPNIAKYSDSVSGINVKAVTASADAMKALAEMTNYIPNSGGVVAWFGGEKDVSGFGNNLKSLGEGLSDFASSVSGIENTDKVWEAIDVAKAIADFTNYIPNSGGVVQWFSGEKDVSSFAGNLKSLGGGLSDFGSSVSGIENTDKVWEAIDVAKAIADLTHTLPDSGGVAQWFGGSKDVASFGSNLKPLGDGISEFASSVSSIESMDNAVEAVGVAKAIADMTHVIPNSNGIAQWFSGEKDVSSFAKNLSPLGQGLYCFWSSVACIEDIDQVSKAVDVAKQIAEMTNVIPNSNGVTQWFSGNNDVSTFARNLQPLGQGLYCFWSSVACIEDIDQVSKAVGVAKKVAELTEIIPKKDGIAQWFSGTNDMSYFAKNLQPLGNGLFCFWTAVACIEDISKVSKAVYVAKKVAELTEIIPKSDGIQAWFSGTNDMSYFAQNLEPLGLGIFKFASSVSGILFPDDVSKCVDIAEKIAKLTEIMPKSDGIQAWFSGTNDMSTFAKNLEPLGQGIFKFACSVAGILFPDDVSKCVDIAHKIAELTTIVPKEGGMQAWINGESGVSSFVDSLPTIGEKIKGFADNVEGIKTESVTAAADAAKELAEMSKIAPEDSEYIVDFAQNLVVFGGRMASYFETVKGITDESISKSTKARISIKNFTENINSTTVNAVADALSNLVSMMNGMAEIKSDFADGFTATLSKLGEANVDAFIEAFSKIESDMSEVGTNVVTCFVNAVESANYHIKESGETLGSKLVTGIESKKGSLTQTCAQIGLACVGVLKEKRQSFYDAGAYLVEGFAAGISANDYKAAAEARAMAKAAAKAAEDALKIESPSKVFYKIGDYAGMGFVNALHDYEDKSYEAGSEIADYARKGLSRAIGRIKDVIDSDIDAQPTIRPVLDLSDVRSGVDTIGDLLGNSVPIGLLENVDAISSAMNQRNQNGVNSDVVSAIDNLRKDLGNVGGTTVVNGITYDDGSNVADAVAALIRAARIERRR